jgi:uncharacterized protein
MSDIQELYAVALDSLVAKLRADSYVVAAVLVGSLAYDTVWERSDIDLIIVTEEVREQRSGLSLVEHGVNIHGFLMTRSKFRKVLEGAAQGSFVHSLLGKGHMLFSRDESLVELFEGRHALGERDRSAQLLRVSLRLLPGITKAEKWFYAKRDYDYCFHWIMKCNDALASIEMLLHGEVPSREVIQRALVLNPALFRCVYTDLIHGNPTPAMLEAALAQIKAYLRANVDAIFGLVLDYLREEAEVRSISDINHHFERSLNVEDVDSACEWLADEGYLQKLATPVRVTTKSRVDVEEAAYYYSGEQQPCL